MGFQNGEYCLMSPYGVTKMSKPQYILAIPNATDLSESISKQINAKNPNLASADSISQCLAKINSFDNFKSWHDHFQVRNKPSKREGNLFRGKFIHLLSDQADMIIGMYQEHKMGYKITQNNNNDYIYYDYSNDGDIPTIFPVGFLIKDLSLFCKQFKSELSKSGIEIGHVKLINMFAKFDGHQNYQAFKKNYELKISSLELPDYSGYTIRAKWIFNDCNTLADCAFELIKITDYIQRLQLEPESYEIKDEYVDDCYTINLIGDKVDLSLPRKPLSLTGYDLAKSANALAGIRIFRSQFLEPESFGYLNDTPQSQIFGATEDLVSDFIAKYPGKEECDTELYATYYLEPKILSSAIKGFPSMEWGRLESTSDGLNFIREGGYEYVGAEIKPDQFYLVDLSSMNSKQRDAVKGCDTVILNLIIKAMILIEAQCYD